MRGTITSYTVDTRHGDTGSYRRYRVRWELPSGADGSRRQRSKSGFARRSAAEDFLAEVTHDQRNRGQVRERNPDTLADHGAAWLDGRHDLAATTRDNYRVSLLVHAAPRIGGMRLQDVSPGDLDRLYAELLDHGKAAGGCRTAGVTCPDHGCSPDEHDGLAVKSVQHVHTALHAMFEQARTRGVIHTNPAADAHRPTRSADGGGADERVDEDQVWTDEQARRFLAATADDRQAALWRLLLATGLRRGEAVGLRWTDLDLPELGEGTLRVRQSVTEVRGTQHTTAGKSFDSRRTLTLDADTTAALREHRTASKRERLAAGPAWTDSGRVFVRPDGRGLRPRWVTAEHRRLCDRLGLPAIGVHGMRHTAASSWLRQGVAVHVVSRYLGHADASITHRVYSHAIPSDDAAITAAVGRTLPA